MEAKVTSTTFVFNDEEGTIKGQIEGKTKMPFWEHDLRIRTAIGLLNTVEVKDFEDRMELEKYLDKLKKTIASLVD